MSFFVAGGVVAGTAAINAYSSKKAAKENTKGIKAGLDQSAEISKQARDDVVSLFDTSAKRANLGIQEALNFYKQNAQKRINPYVQGNKAAQNVISLGAKQANNAILGLPVDMSFTNPQQQAVAGDYSGIMGAALPQVNPGYSQSQEGQIVSNLPPTASTPQQTNIAPVVADTIANTPFRGIQPGRFGRF